MGVARELVKGFMFIVIWLLPPAVSLAYHNPSWNWLWLGSFVVTLFLLGHFEDLERITNGRKQED